MEQRVLVVDDEENMRHMLCAILAQNEYRTTAVGNGSGVGAGWAQAAKDSNKTTAVDNNLTKRLLNIGSVLSKKT